MATFLPFLVLVICTIAGRVTSDWWERSHVYQIYVRSFKDSDCDGIGDLNGITSKLEYFNYIDVNAIWLSPIFKSPMLDFGYDISDYRAISPEYGTMEDFECLVARAKQLNIKVILDFVPNHVSSEHEWWQKAIDRTHPEHKKYKEYFVWNKGKRLDNGTMAPPCNWLSIFRGSAWTWVDAHEEYYYHEFLAQQPDLNYRNPEVHEEMKEVLRFWMRKGVDGFRIDSVPYFVEAAPDAEGHLNDEPTSGGCADDPEASCYLNHIYTSDQFGSYELLYEWRTVTDEPEFSATGTRILMAEGYTTLNHSMWYYGYLDDGKIVRNGTQIPLNLMFISDAWSGTGTYGFIWLIQDWLRDMPEGSQPNWVLGNHDNGRIASKFRPTRTDLFNIFLKTLPGIAVTYYGEEIGMTNVLVPWDKTVDPQALRTNSSVYLTYSRDLERTPFQWSNCENAGFSEAENTWLPVADNYTECNVELESCQERSFFRTFMDLMKLRKNPTMLYGGIQLVPIDTEIMAYKREIEGDANADIVVVVLNLERNVKHINLNDHFSGLPSEMEVVTSSIHSEVFVKGKIVKIDNLTVAGDVGFVLIARKNNEAQEEVCDQEIDEYEPESCETSINLEIQL